MTGDSEQDWQRSYLDAVMNTYGPPKRVLARGRGARVWDVDGNEYVDLLGGIAVNALGHAHPALVRAVTTQLETLGHISNLFGSAPQIRLAQRLVALAGGPGRVFFTNSGAEANETAFKITRRTGRTHLVSTVGGFHGRTMGALAVTGKDAFREPFAPLPGTVSFVPYGDAEALAAAVTDQTAAVVVEPVQGEAGVVIPPLSYLAHARELTRRHGALLWIDEVQTGIGRTGTWLAHRNPALVDAEVRPDIVTFAKGLAGGIPIGACLALDDASTLLVPGNHGNTFGGNPVACAAALAVLETIESDGLLARAGAVGTRLATILAADDRVREVRQAGLLIGADLTEDRAAQVVAAGLDAGFLLNNPGSATLRFAPPLVIDDDDIDRFEAAWSDILDAAGGWA